MSGHILLIAGFAGSIPSFRGSLIRAWQDRGFRVSVAAPELLDHAETRDWLQSIGVTCHQLRMNRAGLNLVHDLSACASLYALMRRLRPDIVFCYTAKPVIWGGLAAWMARVPRRCALISGLGYAFTGQGSLLRKTLRIALSSLYAIALRGATTILFQNPDDRADFERRGILSRNRGAVVVNGSGIDTAQFTPAPFMGGPVRFLLIARLLADKGIREYASAAAQLRARYPTAEFHLVGGEDPNPASIPAREVRLWEEAGHILWHGELSDVRPAIASCHVYVLPSYREGTPRSVLEAMSMGRPIVTTDAPGCRETVVDGRNGYLVPVKDTEAVVAAMERFIRQPATIAEMGCESRRIAIDKYDVHKVNTAIMAAMGL